MSWLSMKEITKLYPDNGVLANDRVDLEVRRRARSTPWWGRTGRASAR